MFSKTCEYAIRASVYIAKQSFASKKVSLKEIAKFTDSPEAFIAKILQKLVKTNVINSTKGPNGGFFIEIKDLEKIKLWNIVFAIDGNSLYYDCSLGLKKCNEAKPCPLHFKFKAIREEIRGLLDNTSLKMMAEDYSEGVAFLKR